MSHATDDLALATVVDDAFLPGALVMLDTFIRHHPTFEGPIMVIHDESLGIKSIRALGKTFDRVEFHRVRKEARQRIRQLVKTIPKLESQQRQFYSLEAFALSFPGRVLFCDADLLFQAPINEFLERPEPLVATPDRATLTGSYISGNLPLPATPDKAPSFFNSGLMLIGQECRTATVDHSLQENLDSKYWEESTSGHTDQRVLNRHFSSQVYLMNNRFNYLMHCRKILEEDYQITLTEAHVWHFSNSPHKPWELREIAASDSPEENFDAVAIRAWQDAFAQVMQTRITRITRIKTTAYALVRGAMHNLPELVQHNLFIISPNNSGSTWIKNILATSQHTWNLAREGQHIFGATGPNTIDTNTVLTWAANPETRAMFTDSSTFDWAASRRAWYFQATSLSSTASVFVEKSPPYLTQVAALQAAFKNACFIFLVRNPYAMAESVLRRVTSQYDSRGDAIDITARHILACLEIQRQNIRQFGQDNIVTTYEQICRDPREVMDQIQRYIPVLDDVDYRRTIDVKGLYYEPLRDMNAQQIERLSESDLSLLKSHFEPEAELLDFFGYTANPPSKV